MIRLIPWRQSVKVLQEHRRPMSVRALEQGQVQQRERRCGSDEPLEKPCVPTERQKLLIAISCRLTDALAVDLGEVTGDLQGSAALRFQQLYPELHGALCWISDLYLEEVPQECWLEWPELEPQGH